ncbi:hypothetical protein DICPUDRAFT_78715 [Dictyostelium purpureum]|uniref:Transmembrane protein n=1 Tax=Dictyostelium purpureum TaxID=5786 RepID=F0ZKC2_DICPU|nr:uncharacterized protein DICPUDRAFT_78715 [Dictyostelium purpureum]EGC35620.1 hypothetical protein DICPUDRAFT_78715 [Dictyostelium purpureum]|eukprot:XP_003287857.1 hypothetical protein DICPUDRAFT_78715 [Dictyostelium purpureum]
MIKLKNKIFIFFFIIFFKNFINCFEYNFNSKIKLYIDFSSKIEYENGECGGSVDINNANTTYPPCKSFEDAGIRSRQAFQVNSELIVDSLEIIIQNIDKESPPSIQITKTFGDFSRYCTFQILFEDTSIHDSNIFITIDGSLISDKTRFFRYFSFQDNYNYTIGFIYTTNSQIEISGTVFEDISTKNSKFPLYFLFSSSLLITDTTFRNNQFQSLAYSNTYSFQLKKVSFLNNSFSDSILFLPPKTSQSIIPSLISGCTFNANSFINNNETNLKNLFLYVSEKYDPFFNVIFENLSFSNNTIKYFGFFQSYSTFNMYKLKNTTIPIGFSRGFYLTTSTFEILDESKIEPPIKIQGSSIQIKSNNALTQEEIDLYTKDCNACSFSLITQNSNSSSSSSSSNINSDNSTSSNNSKSSESNSDSNNLIDDNIKKKNHSKKNITVIIIPIATVILVSIIIGAIYIGKRKVYKKNKNLITTTNIDNKSSIESLESNESTTDINTSKPTLNTITSVSIFDKYNDHPELDLHF